MVFELEIVDDILLRRDSETIGLVFDAFVEYDEGGHGVDLEEVFEGKEFLVGDVYLDER